MEEGAPEALLGHGVGDGDRAAGGVPLHVVHGAVARGAGVADDGVVVVGEGEVLDALRGPAGAGAREIRSERDACAEMQSLLADSALFTE